VIPISKTKAQQLPITTVRITKIRNSVIKLTCFLIKLISLISSFKSIQKKSRWKKRWIWWQTYISNYSQIIIKKFRMKLKTKYLEFLLLFNLLKTQKILILKNKLYSRSLRLVRKKKNYKKKQKKWILTSIL
jgi:hypothetical protein